MRDFMVGLVSMRALVYILDKKTAWLQLEMNVLYYSFSVIVFLFGWFFLSFFFFFFPSCFLRNSACYAFYCRTDSNLEKQCQIALACIWPSHHFFPGTFQSVSTQKESLAKYYADVIAMNCYSKKEICYINPLINLISFNFKYCLTTSEFVDLLLAKIDVF